ncbi:hypothetical protein [Lysinibacillus yapensis]|uniref:hypothetical protein n=1 Tax=Ureibacillus yapensis TaxID=2304605 RepID=UPI00131469C6|nr:hypothetical protein [Lysinibacillus yapensis]
MRNRVVYSKNAYTECIYCGEESGTRDHVPSKVFLNKPFPENLPTLPACIKCNNSYSNDELVVSLLVQLLKQKHYGSEYSFSEEIMSRIENERNVDIVNNIRDSISSGQVSKFHNQILNVLAKLAIGHLVWEISEGYYVDEESTSCSVSLSYSFLNDMHKQEINEFSSYFIITNETLPELGSRAYDERILVFESDGVEPQLLLDWVEVQPLEYKYTCYKFVNEIVVKMVINNLLFAEVTLKNAYS